MKLNFNIHYITYPLIVVAALAGIYFSGVYHQKQLDKAKAEQVVLQAKADSLARAKAIADSTSKDSLAKIQIKLDHDNKITIIVSKQRDSLAKEVAVAKDTAQLVTALKAQVVADSNLIKAKDSTITDLTSKNVFLTAEGIRKDKQYADLFKLNTDTNAKLAKANADANPGLLKRVLKNADLLGAELLVCHFGHC